MKILGIESTAHTFSASIVDEKKNVLALTKKAFTTEEGGMIPIELSEHHTQICDQVIGDCLREADCSMQDIDAIAYSHSPGIGHALRIGLACVKALGIIHNKPVVPVNHCIAHLEIGRAATDATDPVMLYASGANTQIIAYEGERYRIFGETLDMGIGNLLDSFARELGLGFPGGPKIEACAKEAKEFVEIPYTVKGMDVSFGGLLTNLKQKRGTYPDAELCYSLQETVFAMLVEVSERAMAHCGKDELVLAGGVACNKRLQQMCEQMCEARGAKCFTPENRFLVDNAAMIAWNGVLHYQAGEAIKAEEAVIDPYLRTDDLEIMYR